MNNFRLLKRTQQATDYSCGASALQSVLSYWGTDVDEHELMKLMGTTEQEGTYPEKMVEAARALGFEAEAIQDLSLEDVREFTAAGHPMIALAQVWRSQSQAAVKRARDEWDAGHYVVVLGVDDEYVYFQDPYIRMCKAFASRRMFEAIGTRSWADISGIKLVHLGIFVRGAAIRRPVAQVRRRSFASSAH
jgi:predicted double-glycine peptidase